MITCSICANSTELRYVENPFDFERPGIGIVLLYMAIEGFVLLWFTLLLEVRITVENFIQLLFV